MQESRTEFDEVARDYEAELGRGLAVSGEGSEFFARGRVQWLARCLGALGAEPKRILDYGCGTGGSVPFLLETFEPDSVLGVDVSERSLEVARETHADPRVRFVRLEEHAPSADRELAFCNGVFHHIPPAERGAAMRAIADSLAPGGYFAFWENSPWSPAARYVMSRIPFDEDAIMVWPRQAARLMRDAGLELVRRDFLFVFPGALGFLRGCEKLVSKLPLGAQYQVLARRP